MIAKLIGTVAEILEMHIVIEVGGVGYLVAVRIPHDYNLNSTVHLHTHLAVRENALDLYGFETRDELRMFETLLKLPKIGPKSAMQILTQADIELLRKAVIEQDASYLSKMSGIGKKSAEKIVLGLKDVFHEDKLYTKQHTADESDVIDALIALGYSPKDARDAIAKIPSDITDTNTKITAALKHIGR